MVTISDSTIRNNVYEILYDLINSSKSGYNNPALYGGYPDVKTISFPNIILHPININESEYVIGTNRSSTTKEIVVQIEIFSEKNKDLDIISDGLTSTIRGATFSGFFLNSVSEDNGLSVNNDSKLKQKTLSLMFMRR